MEDFIIQITPFVREYGVFGVFFLSFIEEIIAPVPSSIVLMAAGFLLLPAFGSIKTVFLDGMLWVVLPAAFGLTLGAILVYSLAYVGGEPLIKMWGKRFGLSWSKVERWRNRITKGTGDELLVFFLRAFPVVPNSLVSAACGMVRYPTRSFIILTFLGSLVRALIMGFIGWSVGEAYLSYAVRFSVWGRYVLIGGAAVIVLAIAAGMFVNRWRKR
ncbi:hypothetical protein COU12_00295 [Candidatus Jorgensenbacteria bacterium CG10_big_fil_rev_8_21_14_0_10_54_38]|uniref:VTT domain-containing protein n=2 Tax=Candidatus Joergenseniibacteriota TaxID=1752739 RepID=A0A2M6WGP4_9BACT|nr:MAG: hypothetical protein COX26_01030 [Candidatus Jorgensenbacteria bacterium CG23_combo_of_CG06-09_8_20_14_all_54_14]PIT91955.1 MAG: hypothetical protein COU12_00295 [Candidatus Jorgensenbacteria bacterium CG10_big_fil_rev_8_21_14_0_10_54_38]